MLLLNILFHLKDAYIYLSVSQCLFTFISHISQDQWHGDWRRLVGADWSIKEKSFISYPKKQFSGWVPVAHACNPNYLGGKDQEDHG
jgi:hypothetical protein